MGIKLVDIERLAKSLSVASVGRVVPEPADVRIEEGSGAATFYATHVLQDDRAERHVKRFIRAWCKDYEVEATVDAGPTAPLTWRDGDTVRLVRTAIRLKWVTPVVGLSAADQWEAEQAKRRKERLAAAGIKS